jgi:hypothetical protein
MLAPYRKLVAAAIGLILLLLYRRLGIDLTGTDDFWIEIVMSLATAFSVWLFPNRPKVDDPAGS